jgi:flagellar basal-body rod modification protein FlgD
VGLIGKTVQISGDSGTVTGTVSQLSFDAGEPRLSVRTSDGSVLTQIRLSQLLTVQ